MRFSALSLEIPDVHPLRAERAYTAVIEGRLEDQVFKCLMPVEYRAVSRLVHRKRAEREAYTEQSVALLKEALEEAGVKAAVYGRTKHLYSVYQKLQRYHVRGMRFSDIYDMTAMRVIVESVRDCYYALAVVHETWSPVVGRFDDYIASPKPNRYQSLHTSLVGDGDRHLEVQIRTRQMHRIAEEGGAAHLAYKQTQALPWGPRRRQSRPRRQRPFAGRAATGGAWDCVRA
jgi:GTP pyrophosphokinase